MTALSTHKAQSPEFSALHISRRRTGYTAFGWVVVFIAFHIYWALGGTFGFGDASATVPKVDNTAKLLFSVVVTGMFVIGTALPLAVFQPWGRRFPAWLVLTLAWIGCALLALRGFSGLLDSLARDTGLLKNGLSGLTYKQTMGVDHPDAYTLWSSSSIDLYFAIGGVLFGLLAIRHRRVLRLP